MKKIIVTALFLLSPGITFAWDVLNVEVSPPVVAETSESVNITVECQESAQGTFGIFNSNGVAVGGSGCSPSSQLHTWSLEQWADDFGFPYSILIEGTYTIAFFDDDGAIVTWDGVTPELAAVLLAYPDKPTVTFVFDDGEGGGGYWPVGSTMTAGNTQNTVLNTLIDWGTNILIILAAVVAVGVAYLIYRWSWKRIKAILSEYNYRKETWDGAYDWKDFLRNKQ